MRRLVTVLAIASAATLGGALTAGPASAEPALCLDVNIDINGQGGAESICLPPEGSEPPALPELPALPGLPGFGF